MGFEMENEWNSSCHGYLLEQYKMNGTQWNGQSKWESTWNVNGKHEHESEWDSWAGLL